MDKFYYLYEDHLTGGVYWGKDEFTFLELYCERCGEQDDYIGYFSNKLDLEKLLKEKEYGKKYIERTICSFSEEVGYEK